MGGHAVESSFDVTTSDKGFDNLSEGRRWERTKELRQILPGSLGLR
jgi:hypothetical protein